MKPKLMIIIALLVLVTVIFLLLPENTDKSYTPESYKNQPASGMASYQ